MNTKKRLVTLLITLVLVVIPFFLLFYIEGVAPPSVPSLNTADLSPFSPDLDTGIITVLKTRHEEVK
ncbi:MAG: hypothetical protein AAB486_01630 [Patescibacteria group bacterium]